MSQQDWAAIIKDGQARAARLQARLAAGEDEATAAHAEGFLTRNDVNARVRAVAGR